MTSRRKKAHKIELQQFIIEYLLDHPCIDCGEDHPLVLEFDHRDPSIKLFNIGNMIHVVPLVDWTILRDEIDKCDVRCANCHKKRTAQQFKYTRYQVLQEMGII